jgi:epoxyqueuosine reductase
MIAIGNSGDPALAEVAQARLDDASPLVRGAAVWALGRLLPKDRLAALAATHAAHETDPAVTDEWTAALRESAA